MRKGWEKTNWEEFAGRAHERRIPIMSLATRWFLQEVVQHIRPLQVLEVGAAVGYSMCLLADQISARGGHIISFEISAPSYHAALQRRERSNLWNSTLYHIDLLQADLTALGIQPLDFVFIDGMKIQYAAYLHTIRPYCAPGCTIVFDDVISQQDKMDALWEYLKKENMPYEIKQLEADDGVAVVKI